MRFQTSDQLNPMKIASRDHSSSCDMIICVMRPNLLDNSRIMVFSLSPAEQVFEVWISRALFLCCPCYFKADQWEDIPIPSSPWSALDDDVNESNTTKTPKVDLLSEFQHTKMIQISNLALTRLLSRDICLRYVAYCSSSILVSFQIFHFVNPD